MYNATPKTQEMTEDMKNDSIETDALPGMSAMCLTYGRIHALEEAIQCFLLQDYAGPKELVVLNDMPEQILLFEHPEVQIINASRRFETVGKKRDVCAHLATYDWLLPWDDDDIYLPHRMRYSMQQIQQKNLSFFKPFHALFGDGHKIHSILRSHNHHPSCCFSRELFDAADGYTNMGSGQDQVFEFACRRLGHATSFEVPLENIYYFYRWGGPQYRHLSGHYGYETGEVQREIQHAFSHGRDIPSEVKQKMRCADPESGVRADAMRRIQEGTEPSGVIHLAPQWRHDYVTLSKQFLQSHNENSDG